MLLKIMLIYMNVKWCIKVEFKGGIFVILPTLSHDKLS